MVAAGFLNAAQEARAESQRTQLAQVTATRSGTRYFADWAADQVSGFTGLGSRDLTVVTTLDPRLQEAGERAIAETLAKEGEKSQVTQGALVAMSLDGAVRALVGGRDYGESQFNRATQAFRQPGSSFKPFVYLAALEHGVRPQDRIVDGPVRIGTYQPHNYGNKYYGEVTVAEALAQSMNSVAVQLEQRVGVDAVIADAHRLGISSELNRDMSLALGTANVTLMELTAAYAAFASGGQGAWPYAIVEIRDKRGAVLYSRQGSGPGEVMQPSVAGAMNQMLAGVIDHGTGKAAQIGRPVAGKTGTTQDYRDAWFEGYTADLVTGVWFGNDDNTPMNNVTGGTLPARTWHDFMLEATKGQPVRALYSAPAAVASNAPAAPRQQTPPQRPESSPGWIERIFGGGSRPSPPRQEPLYGDTGH